MGLSRREFPPGVLLVLLGTVTFVMLHLHFLTSWELLYADQPWAGFEDAARRGLVDPWFGNTPRSLRVTQGVIFVVALCVGVLRGKEAVSAGFTFWLGIMIPLIPVLLSRMILNDAGLVTFSPISERPLTTLGPLVETVRTAAPVAAGIFVAAVLRWFGRVLRG